MVGNTLDRYEGAVDHESVLLDDIAADLEDLESGSIDAIISSDPILSDLEKKLNKLPREDKASGKQALRDVVSALISHNDLHYAKTLDKALDTLAKYDFAVDEAQKNKRKGAFGTFVSKLDDPIQLPKATKQLKENLLRSPVVQNNLTQYVLRGMTEAKRYGANNVDQDVALESFTTLYAQVADRHTAVRKVFGVKSNKKSSATLSLFGKANYNAFGDLKLAILALAKLTSDEEYLNYKGVIETYHPAVDGSIAGTSPYDEAFDRWVVDTASGYTNNRGTLNPAAIIERIINPVPAAIVD